MKELGIAVLGGANGVQYGLLAIGLVLIYRSNRFINFAQAGVGALSAIVVARLSIEAGLPYLVSLLGGVATSAAVAILIERLVVQRLFESSRLVLMIASIALAQLLIAITEFAGIHIGRATVIPASPFRLTASSLKSGYPVPFKGHVVLGGVVINSAQIISLVVGPLIAVGLALFFSRTHLGRVIRATASNRDAARLAGVSVRRVSMATWALAGTLAGLAAVLAQPSRPPLLLDPPGGAADLLRGLAPAVLAGFIDFRLAFVAGVVVGVIEESAVLHINSPGIGDLSVLAVLVVGLLVRGRRLATSDNGGLIEEVRRTALPERLRNNGLAKRLDLLGWVALMSLLWILPWFPGLGSEANGQALTLLVTLAIAGYSLLVLTGWAGQLSLGQYALLGVGAFTASRILNASHWGYPAVLIAAGLASALTAVIIGLPAIRFPGVFLAVSTLGFAVLASSRLFLAAPFSPDGTGTIHVVIQQVTFPVLGRLHSYQQLYHVSLGVLLLVVLSTLSLRRSGIRRALVATRDNEAAAAATGVNPVVAKVMALAVSGFVVGLAGCLFATANTAASFRSFAAENSLLVISIAFVGGLDGLVGPVLGAFAVFGFAYLVPGQNTPAVQYIFSSLLLLIVLLRSPRGLVALVEAGRTRLMSLLVRSVEERPFAPISASPPLVADHVGVSFGGLRAVDDVSICVGAGEIVGLIGGNGAGKTTLMNCVSGHLTPDEGTIVIHGQRVEDLPPQFRAQLGSTRSFQNAALYPGLTVLECVLLSLDNKRPGSLTSAVLGAPWLRAAEREKRTEAMRCLEELGLADSADALTSQLSTGMRRLVDFASVIASRPSLLLLDEPTAGIAQREVESFAPVLRRLQADGCAILLIEHDMPLVMSVSDRVYCMEAGRVISEGPPAQVSADPRVIASYLGSDPSAIKRSDTTAATRASRRARSGKPADRAPAGATQDGSARRRRSASSGIATAANSVREPAEGASDEIRT